MRKITFLLFIIILFSTFSLFSAPTKFEPEEIGSVDKKKSEKKEEQKKEEQKEEKKENKKEKKAVEKKKEADKSPVKNAEPALVPPVKKAASPKPVKKITKPVKKSVPAVDKKPVKVKPQTKDAVKKNVAEKKPVKVEPVKQKKLVIPPSLEKKVPEKTTPVALPKPENTDKNVQSAVVPAEPVQPVEKSQNETNSLDALKSKVVKEENVQAENVPTAQNKENKPAEPVIPENTVPVPVVETEKKASNSQYKKDEIRAYSPYGPSGSDLSRGGNIVSGDAMYLNGHKVPFLYHYYGFSQLIDNSILNQNTHKNGGYASEYTNSIGGVTEFTATQTDEKNHGHLNIDFIKSELALSAKIDDNDSFIVSLTSSSLDHFAVSAFEDEKDFNYTSYPDFSGFYGMFRHDFSKSTYLLVYAASFADKLKMLNIEDEEYARLSDNFGSKSQFSHLGVEWGFKKDKFQFKIMPLFASENFAANVGTESAKPEYKRNYMELKNEAKYFLNDMHTINAGLNIDIGSFELASSSYSLPDISWGFSRIYEEDIEKSKDNAYVRASLYVADEISFKEFNLLLKPGVSYLIDGYNSKYGIGNINPRITALWEFMKDIRLSAGTGLYTKLAPLYQSLEPFGTANLEPEYAFQTSAGIDGTFNILTFSANVFYSKLYNLISANEDNPSYYSNLGEGWSTGFEISAGISLKDKAKILAAYQFTRSRVTDHDGADERPAYGEVPHAFKTMVEITPVKEWILNLDFIYRSGTPTSEIDYARYNSDSDSYVPYYVSPTGERLDAVHELNLKVTRRFFMNKFSIDAYGKFNGVYGFLHKNSLGKVYGVDYSESATVTMVPFMATIGIAFNL